MPRAEWMPVLVSKLKEIQQIKAVYYYDDVPGTLQTFPAAIVWAGPDQLEYSIGGPCLLYSDVVINLYAAGQILSQASKQLEPIRIKILYKLAANIQLNNTVNSILPPGKGNDWADGPGGLEFQDKTHVGIIFRYIVKENLSGSFTVSA